MRYSALVAAAILLAQNGFVFAQDEGRTTPLLLGTD